MRIWPSRISVYSDVLKTRRGRDASASAGQVHRKVQGPPGALRASSLSEIYSACCRWLSKRNLDFRAQSCSNNSFIWARTRFLRTWDRSLITLPTTSFLCANDASHKRDLTDRQIWVKYLAKNDLENGLVHEYELIHKSKSKWHISTWWKATFSFCSEPHNLFNDSCLVSLGSDLIVHCCSSARLRLVVSW